MSNIRLCETRFKTSHAQIIERVACDLECEFQNTDGYCLEDEVCVGGGGGDGDERTDERADGVVEVADNVDRLQPQVVCEEASMGIMARGEGQPRRGL
ncbi:hypothetical protein NL676_010771 [Syzygium grande]|nr:hypothetical protein NL676_010771 [Syzygium grande]